MPSKFEGLGLGQLGNESQYYQGSGESGLGGLLIGSLLTQQDPMQVMQDYYKKKIASATQQPGVAPPKPVNPTGTPAVPAVASAPQMPVQPTTRAVTPQSSVSNMSPFGYSDDDFQNPF